MSTFAVIETGGKQYRVSPGSKIKVEKLAAEEGSEVSFDRVLLAAQGEAVTLGAPHIAGASVAGKVIRQARARKKIIFKYHSKTRYRKKKGHRQHFSEVEITRI